MRLYEFPAAANCHRVSLYLAEKAIELPRVIVNIHGMEQKSPEFLRKNPAGKVPVLETDGGTYIAESAAIVEYLEELFPLPTMIGNTAVERAQVRRLQRIASDGFELLSQYVVHTAPYFRTRPGRPVAQQSAIADDSLERLLPLLGVLELELAGSAFLGADHPTIADCTLFAGLRFASRFGFALPPGHLQLDAWFQRFAARPSARLTAATW